MSLKTQCILNGQHTECGLAACQVPSSIATLRLVATIPHSVEHTADLPLAGPEQHCVSGRSALPGQQEEEKPGHMSPSPAAAPTSRLRHLTWLTPMAWLHWEDDRLPKTLKFFRSSKNPATADFRASSCLAQGQAEK